MTSLILIAIAAIFNALMDITESEKFYVSRLKNLDQNFWYKRVSWNKAKRIFDWKADAWHIAKSLMVVCLCLAVVFYHPIKSRWIDFLLAGVTWNLSFNLFYNKVFQK